ncbi:MAG: FecR domain-containing protein [Chitinispirillaceae bacterium]|jgi:hypothetical protein|nr:FecR domain-containing protein [Chitinispirillaceae bacterium]
MNYVCLIVLFFAASVTFAQPAGSVVGVVGIAELNPVRQAGWKPARMGAKLFVKDQFRTGEESSAELRWANGGVIRVAEKSSLVIEAPSAESTDPAPKALTGRMWANMKAISTSEKKFRIETPTAVAAIRGTIFRVDVGADSGTEVRVYEGKVAVGPGELLQNGGAGGGGKTEIDGPTEVDGPQEVTLAEWVTIVAGQQISVSRSGSFTKSQFNRTADSLDSWVKYNQKKDAELDTKKK